MDVAQVLAWLIALAAFLAIYATLHRRSERRVDAPLAVPWGWLLAIVACAVIAAALGLVIV